MYVLFEDSGRSLTRPNMPIKPIGTALQNSYNGDIIYFSCSGRNMVKEIRAHLGIGHTDLCVFFDVSPDNANTISKYDDVRAFCKDKPNIILIPIISIEYCVLRMLYRFKLIRLQNPFLQKVLDAIMHEDWGAYANVYVPKLRAMFNFMSIETLCKSLLSNSVHLCQSNKTAERHGFFYTLGCNLCTEDCDVPKYTIDQKREFVYSSTPCFYGVKTYTDLLRFYGVDSVTTSVRSILEERGVFYDKMSAVFGLSVVIDGV